MSYSPKYVPPHLKNSQNLLNSRKRVIQSSLIHEYLDVSYPDQNYPNEILSFSNTSIKFWKFWSPSQAPTKPEDLDQLLFNEKIGFLISHYTKYENISWFEAKHLNYASRGKSVKNEFSKIFIDRNSEIEAKLQEIQNLENEISENNAKMLNTSNKNKKLSQITDKEIELEKKKIHQLLNKRAANLKKCSNALTSSEKKIAPEILQFFENEYKKEELRDKTISERIEQIKLANFNLPFNPESIKELELADWESFIHSDSSFLIFKNILEMQTNKIFLLGKMAYQQYKYTKFRNLFYIYPGYEQRMINFNFSALGNAKDSCVWTRIFNYFFLYIILYSETDFSSIVILPKNKKFPKKRERVNINSLQKLNHTFLGFLIIPYRPKNISKQKQEKSITNEIFICVFINQNKKLFLYSLDVRSISIGQIFPDYTILYDELKGLFTYLNKLKLKSIKAYYNESLPDMLFLSTKSKEHIETTYQDSEKYGTFIEVEYHDNLNTKQIQFSIANKILLESTPNNPNERFVRSGGMKHNNNDKQYEKYLNKIIFFSRIMLHQFNLYLIKKYTKKISKKYNIKKYIFYKFLNKNYAQTKLIRYDTREFFANNKFSSGWSYSLQILHPDLLNFSKKSKICEITVFPAAFKILDNYNIDVYYTDKNYKSISLNKWQELISNYKKIISNNITFIYDKKKYIINKKYNIMILNLVTDIDKKKLDEINTDDILKKNFLQNNAYLEYSVKDVPKYVKKQLPYLDYIKNGGNCYFKIHNLMTQEIINIYYKICTLFEHVELYFIKYEDIYRLRFGGCWLKCYNKLKTPQKIDKELLFQKVEQFNYNIYNKMIQQFYDIERFIKEKLNNDNPELEARIFNMQLDTAINFCKEYNLEISSKWKKIIKNRNNYIIT